MSALRPMMHVVMLCCLLAVMTAQPDGEDEPEITFRDERFVQDIEHMTAHLKNRVKFKPDEMSGKEIDFTFFKLHDLDDDNRLDGLELMAALRHAYDHSDRIGRHRRDMKAEDLQNYLKIYYIRTVDKMLKDDDKNNDGYLDYTEFSVARKSSNILERASDHAKASKQSGGDL